LMPLHEAKKLEFVFQQRRRKLTQAYPL